MRTLKWIIYATIIYYIIVFTDLAFFGILPFELVQILWAIILTMPLWNRRIGKYCGTKWFQ